MSVKSMIINRTLSNDTDDTAQSIPLTHFQLVGEFHDTFGHPQRETLFEDCFTVDPKMVPFRISLIREELNEFKDAWTKHDVTEMADALCDLSYVTNGSGQCLGIDLDKLASTMGIDINTPQNFDHKVDYLNPQFFEENNETIHSGVTNIEYYLTEFCESADDQDLQKMGEYLVHILDETYLSLIHI